MASNAGFKKVSKTEPCVLCGKSDYCMTASDSATLICNRISDGALKALPGGGYLHRHPNAPPPEKRTDTPPMRRSTERADAATLHRVYTCLLSHLALSDKHRDYLNNEGFDDDFINQWGFKTWPGEQRCSIARDVRDAIGGPDDDTVFQVPGFYYDDANSRISLTGRGGTLILPIRDAEGRITSLHARLDDDFFSSVEGDDKPGKYSFITSSHKGGPSADQAPCVVSVAGSNEFLLVEGEKKGMLAALHFGRTAVCPLGCNSWAAAVEVLQQLAPQSSGVKVAVAFDGDRATNPTVRRAAENCVQALVAAGFDASHLDWDSEVKGLDDAIRAGVTVYQVDGVEWLPPVPLAKESLPAFPVDEFYSEAPSVRAIVNAIGREFNIDPGIAGLFALNTLSLPLTHLDAFVTTNGRDMPLILQTLIIGQVGSGKSPVFDTLMTPIQERNDAKRRQHAENLEKWKQKRQILNKRIERQINDAAKLSPLAIDYAEKDANLQAEMEATRAEIAKLPSLAMPSLYESGDMTPEAYYTLAEANRGVLALLNDEGDTALQLLGRMNSSTQQSCLEPLIKGWDGKPPTGTHRVGRASVILDRYRLAMGLMIQPGLWDKMHPDFRHSGACQRWLYYRARAGKNMDPSHQARIASDVLADYAELVNGMFGIAPVDGVLRVEFTEEGTQALHETQRWIRAKRYSDATPELIKEHLGKLEMNGVRLCAVLALVEAMDKPRDSAAHQVRISAATVARVDALLRCLLEHAVASLCGASEDPVLALARKVLTVASVVASKSGGTISADKLRKHNRTFGKEPHSEHIDDALQLLARHGYIRHRGGGKGVNYEVNPLESGYAVATVTPDANPRRVLRNGVIRSRIGARHTPDRNAVPSEAKLGSN